ncbi:sigma-54 dependent transcriptional regulator [Paucidesulfovibrio longus]|uniref:sigma-54 dependent transcriptional regulator n=1 Tax=Paucidesulfovibrio longus TaxID=889 RepID=UPI0003B4292E|nr:sigma 54-interacting transcriptional regulator [Paucidesulfovibrio longus]
MKGRVLIVDDEPGIRSSFGFLLRMEGLETHEADGCESALLALEEAGEGGFDLVLADILLRGPSGIELLERAKEIRPLLPVVMVTGEPSVDTAAAALRHGAFDYVTKPVERETLLRVAARALEHGALLRSEACLRRELRTREENIRALLNATTESALLMTREGIVIYANRVAAERIGLPLDEMPGLRAEDMGLASDVLARRKDKAEEAFALGRPVRFRDERLGRVYLNSYYPVLGEEGSAERLAIFAQDITRLTNLEERLRERRGPAGMIGVAPAMQQVYERIEQLGEVDSSVLLAGESGTGKELAAAAIHAASGRSGGPLVKVNCAALADSLLDAELFGHVRGAFTGAVRDRVGRIEAAAGGTLFLDEIGDIPLRTQQKLLRFLENREYERVGDSRTLEADVRVVAATNADLPAKVARGEFREDLYYRLKVMVVRMPSLRERAEDIPALAEHFALEFAQAFGKDISGPDPAALRVLQAHSWPGNVRELRHALEHACILCPGGEIGAEHLPRDLLSPRAPTRPATGAGEDERRELLDALERTNWNKSQAARLLGISRGSLYNRLRAHGIA